jgi:osmotically-inducible protein OsmY
MMNQKKVPVLTLTFTALLLVGLCGCEKSEGIVSSGETLASVTAEVVDMELATAVNVALADQNALADVDIAVMVNDGAVSLNGIVYSQTQRELAVRTVRAVPGVKAIDDSLGIVKQN